MCETCGYNMRCPKCGLYMKHGIDNITHLISIYIYECSCTPNIQTMRL